MLTQTPPEHIEEIAKMLQRAGHIILVAEGYAEAVAEMTAQQLRHRGISAEAVSNDPSKKAAALMNLSSNTLVIGISATSYGLNVARALELARLKGCATLGIIGSLGSPVNRVSDKVIFAPTDVAGPLPSIVALVAALAGLVQIASKETKAAVENHLTEFQQAYQFLTRPELRDLEDGDEG
jgi:DNA-binding MurR/RpiR family transcriptional regulator